MQQLELELQQLGLHMHTKHLQTQHGLLCGISTHLVTGLKVVYGTKVVSGRKMVTGLKVV